MERTLNLIKAFEGLRLEAYKCSAGVWTIGYGHTKGVKKGQKCTKEQADQWLADEVGEFRKQVMELLPADVVDECKIAALTSFAYNVGVEAFKTSTLLQIIKEDQDDLRIVFQFSRWKRAGGIIVMGLFSRRKKECLTYFENYAKKNALRGSIERYFSGVK